MAVLFRLRCSTDSKSLWQRLWLICLAANPILSADLCPFYKWLRDLLQSLFIFLHPSIPASAPPLSWLSPFLCAGGSSRPYHSTLTLSPVGMSVSHFQRKMELIDFDFPWWRRDGLVMGCYRSVHMRPFQVKTLHTYCMSAVALTVSVCF